MLYQLTYEIVTQFNYVMWYSWMMNFISQFPPMWWIEIVSTMGEMKSYHTASFWNITIQWTSHDDLTEKILYLSILKSIEKIREIRVWRKLFTMVKCVPATLVDSDLRGNTFSVFSPIYYSFFHPNDFMFTKIEIIWCCY